jgi:hypothetical protein
MAMMMMMAVLLLLLCMVNNMFDAVYFLLIMMIPDLLGGIEMVPQAPSPPAAVVKEVVAYR